MIDWRDGRRGGFRRSPAVAHLGRVALIASGWMAVSPAVPLLGQGAGGECYACHATLAEPSLVEPATEWEADAHRAAGLACSGCHGGDARAADESTAHAGMLSRPARERIPALCGRCHSNQEFMRLYDPDIRVDQVEVYFTSRHGQLLRRGDGRVATCVDCHSAHRIQSPDEPDSPTYPANIPDRCGSCHADPDHMAPYDIDTDQVDEFKSSVHWTALEDGGDLSAPVCNDCHGNHGAVPPGYTSVGRVCGECHFQIGEYFAASPHDSVFVGLERPGCATCHGNHAIELADDQLLGLGDRSTCAASGCHSESDEGGRVAGRMLTLVDSLLREHHRSDSILLAAEHAGMPVGVPRFELAGVQNAIVGARAILHTANLDSLQAKIDEGLEAATAGYQAGEGAFAELGVRRLGLAVSAVVILALMLGLLVKIRELEDR